MSVVRKPRAFATRIYSESKIFGVYLKNPEDFLVKNMKIKNKFENEKKIQCENDYCSNALGFHTIVCWFVPELFDISL